MELSETKQELLCSQKLDTLYYIIHFKKRINDKIDCRFHLCLIIGHNQSVSVSCVSQFQPSHNSSVTCNNGTWSRVAKCIPAKCTELPDAPRNGMVVAPNLDHGMIGKFEVNHDVVRKV